MQFLKYCILDFSIKFNYEILKVAIIHVFANKSIIKLHDSVVLFFVFDFCFAKYDNIVLTNKTHS